MRLPLLSALITCATIVSAQDDRPKAGVTLDETRTVRVLQIQPGACISVALDGAQLVLDRAALERLVATRPGSWTNEAERLALIAGKRAERLLAATSPGRDAGGCNPATSDAETEYLILAQLEQGTVAVRDTRSNKIVDVVHLRFVGERTGPTGGRGYIMVSLPGTGHPFLVVNWWVS